MAHKLIVPESEGRKKLSEVTTVPYDVYISKPGRTRDQLYSEIFPEENKRKDGRSFSNHRKVYLECGIVKDARGSAYVAFGGTKVVASVTGPVEMSQGIESEDQGYLNCEVKFSQFSCKSREEEEELGTQIDTVTDAVNRAIEPIVIKEELSNVQINVTVVVVEADGSAVSAAVVASCLAIASARLPLKDLVASSSLCIFRRNGASVTLIDPNEEETTYATSAGPGDIPSGSIVLSYMASSEQISDCILLGRLDLNTVKDSMDILKEHCSNIYNKMQKVLINDVNVIKDVIEERNKIPNRHETTDAIQESLKHLSTK